MPEHLIRVHPADLEIRADGTGRTVCGIACPYGEVAEVSDGGRPYKESFAFGSYARTIAERGNKVKFMAAHSRGTFPLGRATLLREDATGLYAELHVSATSAGDEALELIRDHALDGLSVGFSPVAHQWSPDRRSVVRTEVGLREISAVAFAAYPGAVVLGVRSAEPTLTNELARCRLEILRRRPPPWN